MKNVLYIILVSLTACGAADSQKQRSHLVYNEPIPLSPSDTLDSKLEPLERKIDRLEALILQMRTDKAAEDQLIEEYSACMDKCLEIPADFKDPDIDWNITHATRIKCFDKCKEKEPTITKAIGC